MSRRFLACAVVAIRFAMAKIESPCTCPTSGPTSPSGNGSSSGWRGPDWSSYQTGDPLNLTLTGPEPVPRPISDPAVVLLVKTTQRLLLKQYDNLATIACFMQGNSVSSCRPPWISGFNWSNETLGQSIMANTATNPSWECSSDKLYLSNNERVFYGFTSENVTDGLQGIAHSASLFASLACTYNSTCAAAYSNDTAQMYYDFRNHINVTFFDYMHRKLPSNNSKSYCPNFVGSQASALTLVTTSFNGGKEYFGIHDVVFMPGVAQTINGTLEEAKKEFRLLLGTTLRKAEGVFLNMILFTWGSKLGLERRADASFEEEVYPGCPRREWILNGGCEGVIPPREFDLAGSVVPMPERDRWQVLAELAGSNDLMSRDTHCNGIKTSITNSINNFKIGKAAFEASTEAIAGLLTAYQLSSSVLEISFLAAEAFEIIGVMGTGIIMTIAVCEAFGKACDLFPKAVVESSAAMAGKLNWSAGAALVAKWAQEGYKKGSPFYKAIDAGIVLSGALVAGAFTANKYIEIVLDGGITYFQAALECCGDDCASAVCQQAGQACLLNTGAFWGGSPAKGLNCGAF